MSRWIRTYAWPVLATALLAASVVVIGCSTGSTASKTPQREASAATEPASTVVPFKDVLTDPQDWPDLSHRGQHGGQMAQQPGRQVDMLRKSEQLEEQSGIRPPVPPSSLPAPSEELWIISKPANGQIAQADDVAPRSGALVVKQDDKILPFPLKHTDVKARIDGYIASVDVVQQYHNPFDSKIEAVYVFPLPENAAVNEFVMTVGDRVIRGIIREKEEAKQIYEDAKRQGYVASLLEQDRPNIFTQKVANIEPGKQVDVSIRYFHTLAYVDGWYEYVFPMVVGPRFNPPMTNDGVGAVARGATGTSGQKTEVQYLAPGERSGHDVSLRVDIDAGVDIEEITSVNHRIDTASKDRSHATISIQESDRLPNKDFVLRYRVAGDTMKSAVIAQRDANRKGGYFALMLYPPKTEENLKRRPVDLCFTLDVSGSMTGAPMEQSKSAIQAALGMMQEGDTFQIVRFAGSSDQLADAPLPATKENIARARKFIQHTEPGGGTMMLEGIKRSLSQSADEERVRYVCMLTDGYIGNEAEIVKATRDLRGPTRVFGFGVGSSPNRFLLDGMSRAGAGAVAYLSLNDKGEDVMRPFFERISKPVMTGIEIDTSLLLGAQVNPFKIPDAYVGRAVLVTGRFEGEGGSITVRGRVGEGRVERTFEIKPADPGTSIASVWARQQISALCDHAMFEGGVDLPREVKQIALNYSLLSDYTSFVAVDASRRTEGTSGTTVVQPVPVPEGVKYETTVTPGALGAERQ